MAFDIVPAIASAQGSHGSGGIRRSQKQVKTVHKRHGKMIVPKIVLSGTEAPGGKCGLGKGNAGG